MGDASVRSKNSPVLVEGLAKGPGRSGIASVSCGSNHTLACTTAGEVFSWGEGRYGALGVAGVAND